MSAERFFTRVEFTNTCWLWQGVLSNGYGKFSSGSTRTPVHRYAYEFCVGPIPEGLEIDHLCRVRNCVNPDHLEPVTRRTNLLRSPITRAAINIAKTHCPHGHPYSEENTYAIPTGGRACWICKTQERRRYQQIVKRKRRLAKEERRWLKISR